MFQGDLLSTLVHYFLSHFAMTTVTCGKAFPEKRTEDADTAIISHITEFLEIS